MIRELFGNIEGGPLSGGPSSLRARKGQALTQALIEEDVNETVSSRLPKDGEDPAGVGREAQEFGMHLAKISGIDGGLGHRRASRGRGCAG